MTGSVDLILRLILKDKQLHIPILCLSYEKESSEVFDGNSAAPSREVSSILRRSLRIELKLVAVSCSVFTFHFPRT
jgi:hypothetical protein